MSRLKSERGAALLLTLTIIAILATVAHFLARTTLDRALLYGNRRESQYGQMAAAAALAEIHACLQGQTYPASADCPQWGAWAAGGSSQTAEKTVTLGPVSFTIQAEWHSDERLELTVEQQ